MRKNALKNFARGGKGKANSKFNKIFLKSYSPTVTHDKIFVYDFCVYAFLLKNSFEDNFLKRNSNNYFTRASMGS